MAIRRTAEEHEANKVEQLALWSQFIDETRDRRRRGEAVRVPPEMRGWWCVRGKVDDSGYLLYTLPLRNP